MKRFLRWFFGGWDIPPACVLFVVAVLVLAAYVVLGHPSNQLSVDAEQLAKQIEQQEADFFVQGLKYIKDPRTGLCYAVKINSRGYTFTLVPEDRIPKELLQVSTPPEK